MTDPKAIDISPEAVGAVLDDMRSGQNELDAMGLLSALSAALSEARGKVGELEALREQQAAAFVKFAKDRPVAPHPVDQTENLRRAMTTDNWKPEYGNIHPFSLHDLLRVGLSTFIAGIGGGLLFGVWIGMRVSK